MCASVGVGAKSMPNWDSHGAVGGRGKVTKSLSPTQHKKNTHKKICKKNTHITQKIYAHLKNTLKKIYAKKRPQGGNAIYSGFVYIHTMSGKNIRVKSQKKYQKSTKKYAKNMRKNLRKIYVRNV